MIRKYCYLDVQYVWRNSMQALKLDKLLVDIFFIANVLNRGFLSLNNVQIVKQKFKFDSK